MRVPCGGYDGERGLRVLSNYTEKMITLEQRSIRAQGEQ